MKEMGFDDPNFVSEVLIATKLNIHLAIEIILNKDKYIILNNII